MQPNTIFNLIIVFWFCLSTKKQLVVRLSEQLGSTNNMKEYKLMLTVPEENILWDIVEEKAQTSVLCYSYLSKSIDLEKWKLSFFSLYRRWVEEDDYSIYDINNDVNISIINALVELNKEIDFKIYYWFDVDRDRYPNYIWEKCPLSQKDLICLPKHYHKNNRKASVDYPLIFPDLI